MAYYSVRARFNFDRAAAFHRELTDGTIAHQKPDGREIVDSMDRARLGADGYVRWSEMCFCHTPLEHERATVYDRYFSDLHTERIDGYEEADGEPFMERLAAHVSRQPAAVHS